MGRKRIYITNEDLLTEINNYHLTGEISEKLHLAFYEMGEGILKRSRFINYCHNYKHDMLQDAYIKCITVLDKFNHENTLYNKAVEKNGLALEFVPVDQQTIKIIEIAVQQNGLALEFAKTQTDKICELAVQQNGLALKFVKTQTDKICELAVQQNGLALEFVNNKNGLNPFSYFSTVIHNSFKDHPKKEKKFIDTVEKLREEIHSEMETRLKNIDSRYIFSDGE